MHQRAHAAANSEHPSCAAQLPFPGWVLPHFPCLLQGVTSCQESPAAHSVCNQKESASEKGFAVAREANTHLSAPGKHRGSAPPQRPGCSPKDQPHLDLCPPDGPVSRVGSARFLRSGPSAAWQGGEGGGRGAGERPQGARSPASSSTGCSGRYTITFGGIGSGCP